MRQLTDEGIAKLNLELVDHLNAIAEWKERKRNFSAEASKGMRYREAMVDKIRQQLNSGTADPEQMEIPA